LNETSACELNTVTFHLCIVIAIQRYHIYILLPSRNVVYILVTEMDKYTHAYKENTKMGNQKPYIVGPTIK
jgi:hypothetical protein